MLKRQETRPTYREPAIFARTCPDCCGDVGLAVVAGGWQLRCLHCGYAVSARETYPAGGAAG